MYFWQIEKLKDRMVLQPLSDGQTLPYLIAFLCLRVAVGFLPAESLNAWDHLGTAFSLLLTILGTVWLYRQNGGASGKHFLSRYFAIGWVVGIRWASALIVFYFLLYAGLSVFGIESKATAWYDVALVAIAELGLYWTIGSHISNVASRTQPAEHSPVIPVIN